jgi:hypothetical protein
MNHRVPHLRRGFIAPKVGHRAPARSALRFTPVTQKSEKQKEEITQSK